MAPRTPTSPSRKPAKRKAGAPRAAATWAALLHDDSQSTEAGFRNLGVVGPTLNRGNGSDWERLRAELDRFYAFGYGAATQRAFLHHPHPVLGGQTPAEVLGQTDGFEQVRRALRHTLIAVRSK